MWKLLKKQTIILKLKRYKKINMIFMDRKTFFENMDIFTIQKQFPIVIQNSPFFKVDFFKNSTFYITLNF